MAGIEIKITDKLVFSTELDVRMSNLNPANHLGHDAFVALSFLSFIFYYQNHPLDDGQGC